jgi:hypothetical protein
MWSDVDPVDAGACDRFVILSTPGSGSLLTEKILNKDPSTTCEGEFFNFEEGKSGKTHADVLNTTADEIRRNGVRWWYEEVFSWLEKNVTKSPCAVGFRASENPGLYGSDDFMVPNYAFNYEELKPLLEDRTVKKIILERADTKAQWFSIQRGCYLHDVSNHHAHDSHSDQAIRSEHVQNSEYCGPPGISNFTLYKQTKDIMYRRWYELMKSTSQPYVAIKTEDLGKPEAAQHQLHEFIFPPVRNASGPPVRNWCESCSEMARTIYTIKDMVDRYSEEFDPHVQLSDALDPREGMSDIHFALLPGYQILGESSIDLSDLPWVYQCGIESAVRTGSNVTFWYRGFPEGHVRDDITGGKLQLKHHTFQSGTQTGDWWIAHSSNDTLDCPNSDVTVSDYIRQDIVQRFGGIYMDLDMIIIDDRLPHGPDGVPSQNTNHVWKDHKLVANYMKYSPTTRFGQCMFDMWELHWNAYQKHHAQCPGGCRTKDRDFDDQWGFMGPSLVTHAYLSCKDDSVSVYPPSAFGNDPYPCNVRLVHDGEIKLGKDVYALHACHEVVSALEGLGGNMKLNTTMARVMLDRCPETSMRMYSRSAVRTNQVSESLIAYSFKHP